MYHMVSSSGIPWDILCLRICIFRKTQWEKSGDLQSVSDSADLSVCGLVFLLQSFWSDKSPSEFYRKPDYPGICGIWNCPRNHRGSSDHVLFAVVSSDKVVYLFGRISPRLSLLLSILLRCVPRVKERARKIEISREGIGKGVRQGNILERFLHGLSLISIVITWTLEDFVESTVSMKSRGYSLRGRTAFSIYRFDNRDRSFVVMIFLCLTFVASAILLDQTEIYYNPEIIMNPVTPMSFVFYVAYAVLLLLPMGLQIAGEIRYKRKK